MVKVPLDRGHGFLPLEARAVASVVLKDRLVVNHEIILLRNFNQATAIIDFSKDGFNLFRVIEIIEEPFVRAN